MQLASCICRQTKLYGSLTSSAFSLLLRETLQCHSTQPPSPTSAAPTLCTFCSGHLAPSCKHIHIQFLQLRQIFHSSRDGPLSHASDLWLKSLGKVNHGFPVLYGPRNPLSNCLTLWTMTYKAFWLEVYLVSVPYHWRPSLSVSFLQLHTELTLTIQDLLDVLYL